MARYRFRYKGIICDVYEPKSGSTPYAAIFLYGFPATIGENSATDLLLSCGFTVLQPHYSGTYDSDGLFSPQSAIETLQTLIEAMSSGEAYDLKKEFLRTLPTDAVICVGYSFGCMIALRALPYLSCLRTLLLVSPALSYGNAPLRSGFREGGPEFLDYVRRSRPFTYRLAEALFWNELYSGAFNDPTGPPSESLRSIVGLVGRQDPAFDLELLQQNFISVIQRYTNVQADIKLVVVEDGDHRINSLIKDQNKQMLKEACLRDLL